ncbi:hypothetical protein Bpfe_029394 [Biomphalaria pfeifferi]|uniref:Uncharacterized protein n=1 Tax=Biomphalaria pfeifferi TaxID=112525 RepID=A0AAD8EWC3_BIOPF|nr:hypothetical protein Bpfe_029394 [Biomphalaria pfeifferi]
MICCALMRFKAMGFKSCGSRLQMDDMMCTNEVQGYRWMICCALMRFKAMRLKSCGSRLPMDDMLCTNEVQG